MFSKFKVSGPNVKRGGVWYGSRPQSPKDLSPGALMERVVILPRWSRKKKKKFSSSFAINTE